MSGACGVTPWLFKSGVTLSDCRDPPVPLTKSDPWRELPPLFETMFITTPEVSTSPSPPAVVNVTSSALPTSRTTLVAELPLGGLPIVRPSSKSRPSLVLPPWIGNDVVAGPVTTSLLFVTTPGTRTTSAL